MSFDSCLNFVLKWEGGYKLHKNKTEEEYTFAGIYRKSHPNWEGWKYIDKGDLETAKSFVNYFYYNNYWLKIRANAIKSDKLKLLLFDTAVNLGVKRAIIILQKILRKVFNFDIKIDGIIGTKTLKTLYSVDENKLFIEYIKERLFFYSTLSSKYNVYKKGWINRVFDLIEKSDKGVC